MNLPKFFNNKKRVVLVAIGAFLVLLLLFDFNRFISIIDWLVGVFKPIIIGVCIAFTLNLLMNALNKWFLNRIHFKKDSTRDAIALLLSVVLLILIIILLLWFVIPQLIQSFRLLVQSIPKALDYLRDLFQRILQKYPFIEDSIKNIPFKMDDLINNMVSYVQHLMSGTLDQTYSIATNAINFGFTAFIGLLFSFFLLMSKQQLGQQCRQMLYTYLSEKRADRILYIFHLAYEDFSAYIFGQIFSAVVMFVLYVIVALICRLPYALMIGVIILIFSLIPMFGGYIAYFVSVLLILSVNPWQAVLFSIVYFVISNVEGNIIYPRIVGTSLGLPGVWVLATVTLGANMFGLAGMIFSVPIVALIYKLVLLNSDKILKTKEEVIPKIEKAPDWDYYNYQTQSFQDKPFKPDNVLEEYKKSHENSKEPNKKDKN